MRALRKGLLWALLEPRKLAAEAERRGQGARKLALLEVRAELPFGAVWDEVCRRAKVPAGVEWLDDLQGYEERVLSRRS